MTNHRIVRSLAGAVLVAAIALPVGWSLAPASAAPTPTASSSGASISPPADQGTGRRADRRAERQERIAERLGVTPEELRTARVGAAEDALTERVAAGRLTQDQADRILDAIRTGDRQALRELREEIRAERAASQPDGH